MKAKKQYTAKINPIVFWISTHALSILKRLFKISIKINGAENLPDGAIIFVGNHFTRLETIFLPYELYRLTGKPVMSLAYHGLFKQILGTFLESMGSVSTKAPHRDAIIIRSLLKGDHPWLIFPEGSMIKDKKVIENGNLRVNGNNGKRRPPHAGAALLALLAEFYRQRLRYLQLREPSMLPRQLKELQLVSSEEIDNRETFLVPVNLSYYPFRSLENKLEKLATKLFGEISERMQDELRTEGTMLFSGVRMDITIGKPVAVAPLLKEGCFQRDIQMPPSDQPTRRLPSGSRMMAVAKELTMNVMQTVYHNTQINYDHLAAYLLKYYQGRSLPVAEFAKRLCLAIDSTSRINSSTLMENCHKAHCYRFCSFYRKKIFDFLRLAEQSGVAEVRNDIIYKKQLNGTKQHNFQTIRMDNPFQVILNEAEIHQRLTGKLQRIARYPNWLVNWYQDRAKKRISGSNQPVIRQPSDNIILNHQPFSFLQRHERNKKNFTLAHLSDPHISYFNDIKVADLLNKRLFGYLRWKLHRRTNHNEELLTKLHADLKLMQPDHIAITGDLTHLSLPSEFRKSKEWLSSLGNSKQVTVIPGNHDAYVNTDGRQGSANWINYMLSDINRHFESSQFEFREIFPFLRVRDRIALIGVNSARPSAPHLAIGSIGSNQLQKLEKILADTSGQQLFRVLMIHHPPTSGTVSWRKRLTDASELQSLLSKYGIELVLHGHTHRTTHNYLNGPAGKIPVFGAPSVSAYSPNSNQLAAYYLYNISSTEQQWHVKVSKRVYFPKESRFVPDYDVHYIQETLAN